MKKKLIIALLASLCIGATAAGLVACKGKPNNGNGGNGGGTEQGGGSVEENNDGTVLVKGFNIKAVDGNNNPVANAYFNIGYYNSSSFSDVYLTDSGTTTSDRSKAALLKTNKNGVATLEVDVDGSKTYKLFLADPAHISASGTTPSIPRGYEANLTTVEFTKAEDGKYTVTANFVLDNSWGALHDPSNDLVYSRYYPDYYKDELKVEYTPYKNDAEAGKYNYFTFAPYRAPMPNESSDQKLVDAVTEKGRKAASGKYRISWTADDPSAKVTLNLYSFEGGNYFQRNDDGSPTETYVLMHTGNAPTDAATLNAAYEKYKWLDSSISYENWLVYYNNTFSGSNYITLELSSDTSTTVYSFGYVTDKNCNVTISVERIADAAVWTNEEVSVDMPQNAPAATQEAGSVINTPLLSSTVVVKDDDGFYRLGSKDGKKIYVQLKKPTRANTSFSLEYLSDIKNTENRPQFVVQKDVFDETSNTGVHYFYNYGGVIKGYASLANSDGLYPVNDLIKTVLEHFCKEMPNYQQYGDNYWLAACQYYGEVPDGTENNPYYLYGNGTVTLTNGSAWVVYVPSASGYYEFNYNVPGSIQAKNNYYVELEAQTGLKFEVTGAGNSVSITANLINNTNRHLRYYGSDKSDTQTWHGTEENPLNLNTLLVYMVTIDHSAYNSPLTVSVKFDALLGGMLNGDYIIRIAGNSDYSIKVKVENGYVTYDGNSLSLSDAETLIQLDAANNGTFFIWLEAA